MTHGWRITMFATNTTGGRLADLEVRHRLRARAEDRIRTLKDTGLTNLPLQAFGKNQIWLELAAAGLRTADLDPTAGLARSARPQLGTQTITPAAAGVAGRLITTGRRHILRLSRRWPWSDLLINGQRNLAALN